MLSVMGFLLDSLSRAAIRASRAGDMRDQGRASRVPAWLAGNGTGLDHWHGYPALASCGAENTSPLAAHFPRPGKRCRLSMTSPEANRSYSLEG